MEVTASNIVVESFLKGCFDILDALLSLSFGSPADMYGQTDIQELTESKLGEMLGNYPVAMRARLKRGGAVAMLLTVDDAARFVGLTSGDQPAPKDALEETDLATLKEIATSCLGGGVSSLMDTFGLDPEQLEDTQVGIGPSVTGDLTALLGDGAIVAPFKFASPPQLDGGGVLLFSQDIEAMVPSQLTNPPDTGAAVGELAVNAHLSEAEMSDILSGFSPESGEEVPVPSEVFPSAAVEAPTNLDMVLDIKLVATARLGHVEMPIGEILALGPGSIIEVGHLVDEPIELLVNDKLIARGDVVVIDEKFGLRITEIVSPEERIESLR